MKKLILLTLLALLPFPRVMAQYVKQVHDKTMTKQYKEYMKESAKKSGETAAKLEAQKALADEQYKEAQQLYKRMVKKREQQMPEADNVYALYSKKMEELLSNYLGRIGDLQKYGDPDYERYMRHYKQMLYEVDIIRNGFQTNAQRDEAYKAVLDELTKANDEIERLVLFCYEYQKTLKK